MVTVQTQLNAFAIIAKNVWSDQFSRTVGNSSPWQSTDWGGDWVIEYVSTGGKAWVDGSVGKVTMDKGMDAMLPSSLQSIDHGSIQYDFWVPADISDIRPYNWVRIGGIWPVGVEAYAGSGSTWWVGIYAQWSASTDAYYSFTPQASTWYRVKGVFNGIAEGILGIKVWKVSDPEPSTFQAVGAFSWDPDPLTDPGDWYHQYFSCSAPLAEDYQFDNLVISDYGVPFSYTKIKALTAGAVKKRTMGPFGAPADAVVSPLRFTAGAWIIGGRSGHSRFYDHYGTQPDTVVAIDGPVGPFPSGTDLHTVLLDIVSRIEALELGYHRVMDFSVGAFIAPYIKIGAVIKTTQTLDWRGNPLRGIFDAVIVGGKTDQIITADACIVLKPSATFTANAWFIDLVC